ncbi:phosphotransferase system HPr (HPr) family [Mesobacillus persicus]|uniref:Phosphocarrier protein HPr n=1 Tax=Mesobacillus persicus TaxID=930146 RepID=A0A1H7WKR6_9BACI|nr:HPr family phosphocarrier protein [Mesobacillus persicus]SEM22071.1 phosphotransferase system HPr (HPr) family [Mesobacillus persicus]
MEKKRIFSVPEGGFTVQKTVEFVQLNSTFTSEVFIEKNKKIFNAKSILGLMSLLIPSKAGKKFTIIAKGEDAVETIKQITNFIEKQLPPTSNLSLWDQEGIENVNHALKDSQSRWTTTVHNIAKSYLTVKNS